MNFDALRQLYSLVCAIPEKEFKLNLFYDNSNGNVCGCGLGYAAIFAVCGLRICEVDTLPEFKSENGVTYRGIDAGAQAFGLSFGDALNLFSGPFRSEYDPDQAGMTHKEMWLHRMERFFAEHSEPLLVWQEREKESVNCV